MAKYHSKNVCPSFQLANNTHSTTSLRRLLPYTADAVFTNMTTPKPPPLAGALPAASTTPTPTKNKEKEEWQNTTPLFTYFK
jgi:hypothetical protein